MKSLILVLLLVYVFSDRQQDNCVVAEPVTSAPRYGTCATVTVLGLEVDQEEKHSVTVCIGKSDKRMVTQRRSTG